MLKDLQKEDLAQLGIDAIGDQVLVFIRISSNNENLVGYFKAYPWKL